MTCEKKQNKMTLDLQIFRLVAKGQSAFFYKPHYGTAEHILDFEQICEWNNAHRWEWSINIMKPRLITVAEIQAYFVNW